MTEAEKDAIRKRIGQWKRAAPVMQRLRDETIRSADIARTMRIYKGSATWAIKHRPAKPWSGLVEQQLWFKKMRMKLNCE